MNTISIDLETYSDVDIGKCGVYKYAESPNFEILLFAYSVDGGGVTVIDDAELTNCIMWFSYVKKQFSQLFRHFFKPAPSGGKNVDWLEQMNAQIRALTDGDITKEDAVLEKDCWRALTELDAKAHEAEKFRKKYPNG